jgi:hypothetical protein
LATAGVRFAVNGDAAFITNSHAADRPAGFTRNRIAKGDNTSEQDGRGYARPFLHGDGNAIHGE